ncbi:MAG: low specificity L-threonine aldolase [Bacteroidales bacterium]|nr:low specificity L-threonine aldolase [Bacteroidales bacterium]
MNKRGFASDNNSGVHPEIIKAMSSVNEGHTLAYGNDIYTEKAISRLKKEFGEESEIFFVFIGTAANVLGLDAITQPYNSIICPETAHINQDECGAPDRYTGCKLLPVETPDGKLSIGLMQKYMHGFGDQHHSQPKVISITQATEMGTVYSVEEIKEICDFAHKHNMLVHMDGARIANAAVSLGLSFKEFTRDAGVDVLSFGGTKNGLMYGEAVIFFNKELAHDFKFRRKQGMQLSSKMRYISAQFDCYMEKAIWKTNAEHSNKMASLLESLVKDIPGIKITQKVQANGIFAILPKELIPVLQKEFFFYVWDEDKSEVRWMTSFDTTEEDVRGFAKLLKEKVTA